MPTSTSGTSRAVATRGRRRRKARSTGRFSPADLEPELGPAGIDATVLVQTVNTLDDIDSMLANADRHGFIGAVVGWVPLAGARATGAALDARPHPRLRGIRHLIHHERDPDRLLRADVAQGLDVLARRGLSFDVVATTLRPA